MQQFPVDLLDQFDTTFSGLFGLDQFDPFLHCKRWVSLPGGTEQDKKGKIAEGDALPPDKPCSIEQAVSGILILEKLEGDKNKSESLFCSYLTINTFVK